MPRLGNKHFDYSPEGIKAFRRAKLGRGGKTVMPAPRPGGPMPPRPVSGGPQPVKVGPHGFARTKSGELKHPNFVRGRRRSRRFRRSQGGPVTFGGKPFTGR